MKFSERIRKPKTIIYLTLITLISLGIIFFFLSFNKTGKNKNKYVIPFLNEKLQWADSLLAKMTLDEKIGQLIILETENTYQNKDSIKLLIKKYAFGGLILKEDSLYKVIDETNYYQSNSRVPLLMTLHSSNGFPNFINELAQYTSNTGIETIHNDSLIKTYAQVISDYCIYTGTAMNLYPSFASFTENINDSNYTNLIMSKASIFIETFQKRHLLSCLNNAFYSTYNDKDTSITFKNKQLLYKTIVEKGISAICIDSNHLKEKLTKNQIKQYFENKIGFFGLLIANAIEIDKIKQDRIKQFLNAGVDLLLIDKEPDITFETIKQLVKTNQISNEDLNNKVKKILMAKYWVGLKNLKPLSLKDTTKNLNTLQIRKLSIQLGEASITLVKNQDSLIPFTNLIQKQILVASLGNNNLDYFIEQLHFYFKITNKFIKPEIEELTKSLEIANKYNILIIALNQTNLVSEQYLKITDFIKKLNPKTRVIIVNFGKLQTLKYFSFCNNIVQVYDNDRLSQQLAAQLLFGGLSAKGVLPYSIDNNLKNNQGITNTAITRLKYSIPEDAGLKAESLSKIDSIVLDGITRGAMPGCQIFIAKEGTVIYNKCFGYTTYDKSNKIKWDNLYDIASLTKIVGTTIATMKMYEQGKIKLNDRLEKFFKDTKIDYSKIKTEKIVYIDTLYKEEVDTIKLKSEYKTISINDSMIVVVDSITTSVTPKSNIFKVQIKNLLIHQSGITPSLPILKYIKFKDSISNNYSKYFSSTWSKDSPKKIADNMYLRKNYCDSLWNDTKQLRVYSKSIYQYSDVNMILLQMAIDSANHSSIDKYLANNFYSSLGLQYICFKPLEHNIPRNNIAPTEIDAYWRRQVLQGNVHDPSAALLGGVAGNAGIFTNANDLGILFQMLLNGGKYGGVSYLGSATINLFTSKQGEGYRGLGFDKPSKNNIIAHSASNRSYGHTGFTGTCVWVDPDNKLVYVFLSNRIYPSVKNWKLNTLQIRQKVHQVVYDAIKESKDYK